MLKQTHYCRLNEYGRDTDEVQRDLSGSDDIEKSITAPAESSSKVRNVRSAFLPFTFIDLT